MLEQAAHGLHHPARHRDQPQHQGETRSPLPGRHLAARPERQHHAGGDHDEDAVEERERAGHRRDEPERVQVGVGVLDRGVAHRRALLAVAGEELDGEDVGVAVDDAADEGRAGIGDLERARPGAGHEVGREPRIGQDPDQHGQDQPRADRAEQAHRRDGEDRDVEQRVDDHDREFAHRDPDLRHPVGEAPGEVGLEVRQGVAQGVEVRAPADEPGGLRHHELVRDRLVRPGEERPDHQDQGGGEHQAGAMVAPQGLRARPGQDVDEPAHQQVERGLDAAGGERRHEQHRERLAHRPQVEPGEARHRAGRTLGLVEGREGIDAALEPVEEHAGSREDQGLQLCGGHRPPTEG
jgi:hypothetical protein